MQVFASVYSVAVMTRFLQQNDLSVLLTAKSRFQQDFSKKQSYDWFIKYIQGASAEQQQCLLKFATSFKTIPPYGIEHKITIKYLSDDDEKASLPKSLACLAILSLPTIHSSQKKFNESIY